MSETYRKDTSTGVSELRVGAHLVTKRHWYWHHGIYAGNDQVLHYAGFKTLLHRGPVECITLRAFACDHGFDVIDAADALYDGAEVVSRAASRLGEDKYHLLRNNCEHFCTWCLFDEPRSYQIEQLARVLAVSGTLVKFIRVFVLSSRTLIQAMRSSFSWRTKSLRKLNMLTIKYAYRNFHFILHLSTGPCSVQVSSLDEDIAVCFRPDGPLPEVERELEQWLCG